MLKRIFLVILLVAVLSFFHFRGLFYSDEGYIVHSAQRVIEGNILYKDFFMVYMPASIYLTSFSFILFGKSILAERIVALFVSLLTALVIYLLSKKITKNTFLALASGALYVAWGPSHINFIWPTMLAISIGFFTLLFLSIALQKKKQRYYLLTGIFLGLTILDKQNFATALFINLVIALFFAKKSVRPDNIKIICAGTLSIVSIFLLQLLLTHSFNAFLQNINLYTIQGIILQNIYTTPFIYDGTIFEKIVHTSVYLLPLIVSVVALVLSIRKRNKFYYVALFAVLYYVFSIRPTTDYIHLTPLFAILGPSFLLLIESTKKYKVKLLYIGLFVSFILAGFYTALFKGYYKWDAPLLDNTIFSSNPRTQMWLDNTHIQTVSKFSSFFKKHTSKGEYIFVNYYAPMMYFITDTKNPTRFEIVDQSFFYKPFQTEILQNLKDKKVRYVINYGEIKGTFLDKYIISNYRPVLTSEGINVWEKNN